MAVSYLPSTDVKVFPYGSNRGSNDPLCQTLSEKNIAGILQHVTDKSSFVISCSDGEAKFVLGGYYFEINYTEDPPCVGIQIDEDNDILSGADTQGDNSQFEGLKIADTVDELTNCNYVLDLSVTSATFKYNSEHVYREGKDNSLESYVSDLESKVSALEWVNLDA